MLKTLTHALSVLNLFGTEQRLWTAREVAEQLAIPQVNAYRILETFTTNDYLRKIEQTKQYSLGPELIKISNKAFDKYNVSKLIQPMLESIMKQTAEATYLVKLNTTTATNIDAIKPTNRVTFDVRLNNEVRLFEGASYWAILAFLDEELIANTLATATSGLTASASEVVAQTTAGIAHVREHGWCTSSELFTADVTAIASPLFLEQHVIGSLTIAVPVYRLKSEDIPLYGQLLKQSAAELSQLLTLHDLDLSTYHYY
ncbi:IclR family transcriptional regulator [Vagococcus sp. BWB3-3]|uniref:IclR family transcriptional regulator n=1 Tax=Vagococcus allomyrinae TaxID=2794353 RepID=A0A940SZ04_9ENTE|nr:IclR family transcriptional regulator [Vagococcus allomyrinae]MBP1043933.1 IclR family transcriptional regulator [Vagococcus allomyrinae]